MHRHNGNTELQCHFLPTQTPATHTSQRPHFITGRCLLRPLFFSCSHCCREMYRHRDRNCIDAISCQRYQIVRDVDTPESPGSSASSSTAGFPRLPRAPVSLPLHQLPPARPQLRHATAAAFAVSCAATPACRRDALHFLITPGRPGDACNIDAHEQIGHATIRHARYIDRLSRH